MKNRAPLFPAGIGPEQKITPNELKKMQAYADAHNLLLPTAFNQNLDKEYFQGDDHGESGNSRAPLLPNTEI